MKGEEESDRGGWGPTELGKSRQGGVEETSTIRSEITDAEETRDKRLAVEG